MAHAVTPHTVELLPPVAEQQRPPLARAAAAGGHTSSSTSASSPHQGALSRARAKRSLKQKLHGAIKQADGAAAAEQQEQQAAQRVNAKSLCLQLLAEGRPAAFVDFFRLTHPPTPAAGAAEAADELPESELLYVKQQLSAAEEGGRAGDLGTAYEAYASLARVFQELQASQTAR
jgi:hypothetical protein